MLAVYYRFNVLESDYGRATAGLRAAGLGWLAAEVAPGILTILAPDLPAASDVTVVADVVRGGPDAVLAETDLMAAGGLAFGAWARGGTATPPAPPPPPPPRA